jgi:DnaJ-domain-containing protein 1
MTTGSWIAFAGLFFAIVVQTVGLAFWLGGMSARLRNLEARPQNDDCTAQLAGLSATLAAIDKSVERRFADLEHTMRNLLMGSIKTNASRRKAAEE